MVANKPDTPGEHGTLGCLSRRGFGEGIGLTPQSLLFPQVSLVRLLSFTLRVFCCDAMVSYRAVPVSIPTSTSVKIAFELA
jgi:hypothetical protein